MRVLNKKTDAQLLDKFEQMLEDIKIYNVKHCNNLQRTVFHEVINRMRDADHLFDIMYKGPAFTGSFYEKLRIKDAREFDINLVLKFPVDQELVQVTLPEMDYQYGITRMRDQEQNPFEENIPEYATFWMDMESIEKIIKNNDLTDSEKEWLRLLIDDDGFVIPNNVLRWIQSVTARANIDKIPVEGVSEIRNSASGPAKTLIIILEDDTEIHLDLVPVFLFPFYKWPKAIKNLRQSVKDKTSEEKRNLYLAPKPYQYGFRLNPHEPNEVVKDRMWRMHFPDMEKDILARNPDVCPVIKLLKLLRDSQKWKELSSYCLKTLVIRELLDKPAKKWEPRFLARRTINMLDILQRCLDEKELFHFYFPFVNLLKCIDENRLEDISDGLAHIIEDICDDPNTVENYFSID